HTSGRELFSLLSLLYAAGEMALSEMNAAFASVPIGWAPSGTRRTAASTRCSTAVYFGLRMAMRKKAGRL
ncbi:hypothetical protein PF001_g33391, partial [Phytophthora fragariae]